MRRALPYLVVGLAILLFFVDVAAGEATFFFRDLPAFHLPFHHLVAQALRGDELPLWNPALHLGMPLAADASAMPWYAPQWLLALFDDERAVAWFVLGHLVWAGCGCVLLARVHGASAQGATLAGLSYGLGGYLLALHWNLIYLASAAWLPWLVAAAGHLLHAPSLRRAVPVALCWAALLYAGDAQLALVVGGVLLLQALSLAPRARWGAALGWLVVSGLLTLGLTALQWLPTLGLVLRTQRGPGLPLAEVLSWSLPPARLLDLVLTPDASARLVDEGALDWAASLYPGLAAGVLALIALLRPVDGVRRFALVTTTLFALLALGEHTPLYRGLLALLPGLDAFRYPHKLVVVACLGWSLAGALGLDEVLGQAQRRARLVASTLAGLVALLGWLPVAATSSAALHATVVALALASLLLLVERGRLRPALAGSLLVAWTLLDLGVAQGGQRLVGDPDVLEAVPAAVSRVHALSDGQGAPRLHLTPELIATAERTRTDGRAGHRTWYLRAALDAARLMPNTAVAHGLHYLHGFSPLQPLPALTWRSPAQAQGLLDLCSVAAVVDTSPPHPLPGDAVLLDRPDLGFAVLANTDRWPRAYLLDEASGRWLLQQPTSAVDLPLLQPISGARVHVVLSRMNRVGLELTTPQPGWLILADRWDPDWQARVDGARVALERALGLLRAVPVPAGAHRVEFVYRPWLVAWGAGLGALTALLVLILLVVVRPGRSPPSSST